MGGLGKHIQATRQKRGFTVRALADAIGKTAGYLSRVETRDEIPSPELICQLGDILAEKPERLLRLAKEDLMKRTKEQIEKKSEEALILFRRSRK
jgi:transcriptional regulator with XRE-family HTH domain